MLGAILSRLQVVPNVNVAMALVVSVTCACGAPESLPPSRPFPHLPRHLIRSISLLSISISLPSAPESPALPPLRLLFPTPNGISPPKGVGDRAELERTTKSMATTPLLAVGADKHRTVDVHAEREATNSSGTPTMQFLISHSSPFSKDILIDGVDVDADLVGRAISATPTPPTLDVPMLVLVVGVDVTAKFAINRSSVTPTTPQYCFSFTFSSASFCSFVPSPLVTPGEDAHAWAVKQYP